MNYELLVHRSVIYCIRPLPDEVERAGQLAYQPLGLMSRAGKFVSLFEVMDDLHGRDILQDILKDLKGTQQ